MAESSTTALDSDANLQERYSLEDTTGKNGNTLTNNNTVAFNAAKYSNGADGGSSNTNKYLSVASALGYGGGAYSISFWVKMNTDLADGGYANFLELCDDGTDTTLLLEYARSGSTYTITWMRLRAGVAADSGSYNVPGGLGTAGWHHIVFAYDGSTVKGYLDNTERASFSASGNGSTAQTDKLHILAGRNPSAHISAIIDDMMLFNRQLTSTEVNTLYSDATAYTQTLTETVTLTDTLLKTPARILSDTVTLTDTLLKTAARTLSEVVTLTDTLLKTAARTLSETVSLTDTLLKNAIKNLTDTVNLTDTFERTWVAIRELTETVNLTDTLIKTPEKVLSEIVSLTDTLIKTAEKVLTDTITLTDTLVKGIERTLSDALALTDSLIKNLTRTLTETVSLTDTLEKVFNGIRTGIVGAIRSILDLAPAGGVRDNNSPQGIVTKPNNKGTMFTGANNKPVGITRDPDKPEMR